MIDGQLNTLRILQSASPLLYMLAQEEKPGLYDPEFWEKTQNNVNFWDR